MLIVNKPVGWTLNYLVKHIRNTNTKYSNSKISYSGRLDPMAEGLVILLIDEECKHQDKYIEKSKIYKSELLIGITTDTYDILGLPSINENTTIKENISIDYISNIIYSFAGSYKQNYQNFSSICAISKFTGIRKPLWKWSKENKINEINIPSKIVNIKSILINKIKTITSSELLDTILYKLSLLTDSNNNFRQIEIKNEWNKLLNQDKYINKKWYVIELETHVSKGTYIRTLSNDICDKLNCKGIALSINRIKINDLH